MEAREFLRHSPGEMVVGLAVSPAGKQCVGMTFVGREWILLTTQAALTADRLRTQLKEDFEVDSLPGAPFDWRASIASGELKLFQETGPGNNPVGVFVPSEHFDNLVDKLHNL